MTTWRKTNKGEWVVFGTVAEVKPGRVLVEKKGGSRQTVEVSSVGRPFTANGQQMVYGYVAAKKAAPVKAAPIKSWDVGEELQAAQDMDLDDSVQAEMAWEAKAEMAAELAAERAAERYTESTSDFCGF